ncbi:hypothetical protein N340_14639, partial [Tauraco erythrolophus]
AAIDFLLLMQGHGCEILEGMCCTNLSHHSESIHEMIQKLKNRVNEFQVHQDWLGSL